MKVKVPAMCENARAAKEMRRLAFNRGVRAAAKVARSTINPYTTWRGQAQQAANAILKLTRELILAWPGKPVTEAIEEKDRDEPYVVRATQR